MVADLVNTSTNRIVFINVEATALQSDTSAGREFVQFVPFGACYNARRVTSGDTK
jgi:hypothetical protein